MSNSAALAAAWAAGARAGFEITREGFNGECVFMHCAGEDYPLTNPYDGTQWTIENTDQRGRE